MRHINNQPIQHIYYNDRGNRICGFVTPSGPCKNPPNCRFHQELPQEYFDTQQNQKSKMKASRKSGLWTNEEHIQFLNAVKMIGVGRWKEVSALLGSRTSGQCQVHYFKLKQRLQCTDEEFCSCIEDIIVPQYSQARQTLQNKTDRQNTPIKSNNQSVSKQYSESDNRPLPFDDIYGRLPSLG